MLLSRVRLSYIAFFILYIMDYNFENTKYNINTLKINNCESLDTIILWRQQIHSEIARIKIILSNMTEKHLKGDSVCTEKFFSTKRYRTSQVGLLNQLLARERLLKKEGKKQRKFIHDCKIEMELKFWKDKVKKHIPEKFFIFCDELDLLREKK